MPWDILQRLSVARHESHRAAPTPGRPLSLARTSVMRKATKPAGRSKQQSLSHPERVPLLERALPAPDVRSTYACTGSCCAPLARNRSCAFRNLLFLPPATFAFLSDAPFDGRDVRVYTHGRFADGATSGVGGHSRWQPVVLPTSAAANVTLTLQLPLYIGADLHSNIGASRHVSRGGATRPDRGSN